MLPALAVSTPPASSSSVACSTALPAPRILNDRTGWSSSSFSQISASVSASSRTSGVRSATPSSTSRARRISSSGITARRPSPASSASARWRTSSPAARSSTPIPSDLNSVISSSERRALRPCRAATRRARRGCGRGRSAPRAAGSGSRPPRSASTRAGRRRATRRPSSASRARARSGCSSRRALMCTPGFSHSRLTIGSADAVVVQIDVGVAHRLLGGRDALGAVERPAARAPHDDALERRGPRASRRDARRACVPEPRIASVLTFSRASSRVATPETAAVRIGGDRRPRS